jgi:DNA polymerase-1
VLKTAGFDLKNIVFDTIIASYVLNPEERQHSLDTLSLNLLGKVKIPTTDLIGKGKDQISMDLVPVEKVAAYCAEDIECTVKLKEIFEKELECRNLNYVFKQIELPLIPILAKMERQGIYLDKEELKKSSEPVLEEILRKEEAIYALAGSSFNINSPKQVGEILFDRLNIPCLKKNRSTAQEVLVKLEKKHPIVKEILEYRVLEKLRSTYIEALPDQINPKTGRIHCTFNQITTATGRLSCQNPNLQNIPVKTEWGRTIRQAFRPEKENWSYIACDYSQIELRLLAHLSDDKTLIDAFLNHQDIHKHTASQVLNIPIEKVTEDQRRIAKAVNFGLMYGQQAFGLSQGLMIDFGEASKFIEAYFKRYSGVKKYIEESKERARKELRAVTLFGRERPLPEILSKNPAIASQAERFAINTPLQGSQADLIKLAMIEIDKKIRGYSGYLILQIHDELIFEVPDHEVEILGPLIKKGMESVISLKVPLIVDMKVGKNWKEC